MPNATPNTALLPHTNVKRFCASIAQIAVKWRGNGADRKLHKIEMLVEVLAIRERRAHANVRMPVYILCERVQNNIGAECKRTLKTREIFLKKFERL